MDMTTTRALNQLRHAEFIKGIFHDIHNGPVKIEGIPIITLKGQEYLDRLRSKPRQKVWQVVAVIWAMIIGLSSIVSGIYYLYHLFTDKSPTGIESSGRQTAQPFKGSGQPAPWQSSG